MILLTLGIFLMVINGLTFWLASYLADIWFHVGFVVDGFWPAFWGALIVSVVSIIFNLILKDDKAS
jgi:putative membrane protein